MKGDKEFYDNLIKETNRNIKLLSDKPKEFKIGYQFSYGGILNAYREGDLTFDESIEELYKFGRKEVRKSNDDVVKNLFNDKYTEQEKKDVLSELEINQTLNEYLKKHHPKYVGSPFKLAEALKWF